MNEYSIEQRTQLVQLLRNLKKDINSVIDGLLTATVQDHEVMLLCEQLIQFPELTYEIRKLILEGVTLNNNPIQLLEEEVEKLKSSVMSLTTDLRTVKSVQKSQKMRDYWDRQNPYNNY